MAHRVVKASRTSKDNKVAKGNKDSRTNKVRISRANKVSRAKLRASRGNKDRRASKDNKAKDNKAKDNRAKDNKAKAVSRAARILRTASKAASRTNRANWVVSAPRSLLEPPTTWVAGRRVAVSSPAGFRQTTSNSSAAKPSSVSPTPRPSAATWPARACPRRISTRQSTTSASSAHQ